ncbi:helix-turn-helix domain-containing protein [Sciscionella marina]|uniref:helix-turn-helix domain-containing protein n=1 Tax=Sciscionella marina TaxID=508770 RepID=UPI00037203B3|nr:helix-turn-helix domain-containing protein [Sciscionella marina]
MLPHDPFTDQPPLIPVPRGATLLGISRSAAYRYAENGDLPARKIGGRTYLVTALLRELITEADEPQKGAA